MNKNNKGENVVPIFVTSDQMMAEQAEAEAEYATENLRIFAKFDAVCAVITGDPSALAKVADGEVDLAKAFVEQNGDMAQCRANYEAAIALKAAITRRNDRIYGVNEMAKRARRFASAVARRYSGPTSEVTQIKSKRNVE